MKDSVRDASEREEEWRMLTNASDFHRSVWSYSEISATTEQWTEDAFMGSVQDNTSRNNDTPKDNSYFQGLLDPNSDGKFLLYPSIDISSPALMSPTLDHSESYSAFVDQMWTPTSDLSDEYRLLSPSPHHSGTNLASSEPWDPLGNPRVMQYDSGYVAFVDSPKSSSDQSFCEVPPEPAVSPEESAIHELQDARPESLPLELPAVANQQQLRWEVVSVATYGPPRNDNMTWRDFNHRQPKGRHGPLNRQKAKDARIMRKIGVCWPCRVSKVKASFIKKMSWMTFSLTDIFSVLRAALAKPVETVNYPCHLFRTEYAVDLALLTLRFSIFRVSSLPLGCMRRHRLTIVAVLISHFKKEEVKSLIVRNVESFINPGRVVKVHCGRSFTPMELTVHFFRHKTDTLLNRHNFTGPDKERALRMITRGCAPVGILGVDIDDLKKQCMSCIKSMVSNPAYVTQVSAGEQSGIYRRVLEIIHRYSKVEQVSGKGKIQYLE